jgi:hypothetical protein
LSFVAGKHIRIFKHTTFDLPDDLMRRAKIAAVKRGSSLRDLVAEAIRRLLAEQSGPKRHRMTEAPIKLAPGHTIPIRSNSEIAQLFDREDEALGAWRRLNSDPRSFYIDTQPAGRSAGHLDPEISTTGI